MCGTFDERFDPLVSRHCFSQLARAYGDDARRHKHPLGMSRLCVQTFARGDDPRLGDGGDGSPTRMYLPSTYRTSTSSLSSNSVRPIATVPTYATVARSGLQRP
jgi:hypothetical protein